MDNGKKLQLIAVNTDSDGKAQATLTLGNRAGAGNNVVEAYAVGYQGTAVFTASGTPQAATHINVDAGTNQFGATDSALPLPFVAVVTDAGHNRLGGVPVTFTVTQGGGTLNGKTTYETVSDSDGRALAVLTLGPDAGQDNNVVEANFPGNTGFAAAFAASAKTPGDTAQTAISGVVQDNSNAPIPGVTMRLYTTHQLINHNGVNNNQPLEVVTPVVTDADGHFKIAPVPVGFFKLMADGTTATVTDKHYPTLEYDLVTVAGGDNGVGSPIYLPALDPDAKVCVDAKTGGTLKMASSPGFSLTIAPGSATFPGGSKSGCVTVTPVNPDKVPMVPGFGQQPRYVVTIQPAGTTFNPPAQITIPNMDGLAPHAKTEMYSYDHDLAAFVAIGSATVSADGSVIASDPGIGVMKAGWHCGGNPNATGETADMHVTLAASKSKISMDEAVQLMAKGAPVRDGEYVSWELVDDPNDPFDDPSAGKLASSPSCPNQAECSNELNFTKENVRVTTRVFFRCATTGNKEESNLVKITSTCVDEPEVHFNPASVTLTEIQPGKEPQELHATGDVTLSDAETYGLTWAESVNVDFTVRCEKGEYKAEMTRLNGNYSLQARFLPHQVALGHDISVTGKYSDPRVGGNFDKGTFCNQALSLKVLGKVRLPGYQWEYLPYEWYILEAVQAHEKIHFDHLKPALEAAVSDIEKAIEELKVDATPGMTKEKAIEEIKQQKSAELEMALKESRRIWFEDYVVPKVISDHLGKTDEVEHEIVDPVKNSICNYAKTHSWAVCSACSP